MGVEERSWWRRHWLLLLYIILTIIVTLQRLEPDRHGIFLIYRAAFFDLVAHRNLYAIHFDQMDHFRYSPTFALLFGPMALLPMPLGILIWTAVNAFGLYAILGRLLPRKPAQIMRLLVLGDLVRSIQWSQCNALISALIVASFVACERERPWAAGWAVAGGGFTKIFPIGAGLFALLRPFRWRALLAIAGAFVVLLLLPMLVTGPSVLLQQYHWWYGLERGEAFKPMQSVMDLIDTWSGRFWPRWPTQLAGLLLLLVPVMLRRDRWQDAAWRFRVLCSVLIFCVLFNYGAESASYIIATTGVALWWTVTPRTVLSDVLLLLTLLLSTVAHSSLVPPPFRIAYLDASRSIVMPVLAAFLVIQWELLRGRTSSRIERGQDHVAPGETLPQPA